MNPTVSITIATYNRKKSLINLISRLSKQTYPENKISLIITDDGSKEPLQLSEIQKKTNLRTTIIRQENKGQAAARNTAIYRSSSEIIVIIDDDMNPDDRLIESHVHPLMNGFDVSFGKINTPYNSNLPAFELYHLQSLNKRYESYLNGNKPIGTGLCTGNVAFRRNIFLDIRGFDESLKRSEDRDIGIRFQISGAKIIFNEKAITTHESDHRSAPEWRKKANLYGIYDSLIAKKFEQYPWASPWSFIENSNRLFLLFIAHIITPSKTKESLKPLIKLSDLLISSSKNPISTKLSSLIYPNEYISGVIGAHDGKINSLKSLAEFKIRKQGTPFTKFLFKIVEDQTQSSTQRQKYQEIKTENLPLLTVSKVGFQALICIRIMQLFNDYGHTGVSKFISRLIRHAYGSDFHPQTKIDGGISIVHGFGIVTSKDAIISKGCIIFQNATIGMGRNKNTGKKGSPIIEENVHIGPGATITGPIRIGRNSKIAAGVTVATDVAEGSLVLPALARVEKKKYMQPKEKI